MTEDNRWNLETLRLGLEKSEEGEVFWRRQRQNLSLKFNHAKSTHERVLRSIRFFKDKIAEMENEKWLR